MRNLVVLHQLYGPEDRGSILGRVITKTQKMVLDASLLNTQHDNVRIKSKVWQSWKRSNHIYQPLRSARIWHKVNFFKRSLTGLDSEFSFS